VLTFRNLHNWMDGGYADQALAACFTALKPGGILGIEEHRGRNDKPQDPKAADGYVREDYTIALAKKAGFVLAGSSEIERKSEGHQGLGGRRLDACRPLFLRAIRIAQSTCCRRRSR
jgi:predicted methyltransferase